MASAMHLDFLAYAVDKMEVAFRKCDGERYAGEAASGAEVKESGAVDRL